MIQAKFNLNWPKTMKFSGEKSDLKTGAWVSENYMAWVRVSKYFYSWLTLKGLGCERKGCMDVARMVVAFTAVVSRIMTHSGTNEEHIVELDRHIKEFMSCVWELDIRQRHNKFARREDGTVGPLKVTRNKFGKDDSDPWWMKANCISLFNVPDQIREYGPPLNAWDGGGQGEKFTPHVKKLLPRGVRETP